MNNTYDRDTAASTVSTQPIDDLGDRGSDLIDTADGPRLRGSRCTVCGSAIFPVHTVCLNCGARQMEDTALPECGVLYSFTTVHVSSSRPTPYTLGYIDLDNGVRILADVDLVALAQGNDSRVVLETTDTEWRFVTDPRGGAAA